jgi:hypothetical protein
MLVENRADVITKVAISPLISKFLKMIHLLVLLAKDYDAFTILNFDFESLSITMMA